MATLAAAGASFAQSSVQLDGLFDTGYQSIDYKGTRASGIGSNGSGTSALNIRGTEDLGGGLKADFRVETNWNTVSNNANKATPQYFGNGEIRVGVAGGFGRVDMGAVNYNTLSTFTTGQPFGTAIGSGFRAVTWNDTQGVEASLVGGAPTAGGSQVRAENAIKYVSPVFSGFNASLYKSNKQTKASSATFSSTLGAYDQIGTEELGVNYANGPIAASFSSLKQDSTNVGKLVTKSTVNTLGANYTMGAAKLFVLNQNTKFTTPTDPIKLDYWAVSGTYTMGAVTLMASAGQLKEKDSGDKSKLMAIGADYALSKRTAVYARYESIDDKVGIVSNPSTIAGAVGENTRTRTAIGVRHAF